MKQPRIHLLLRMLPRRAVSRAIGALARLKLPVFVLRPALAAYARAYGVDLQEAARPLGAYRSFLDFFTRRLEPGRRPLPADARAIASPSDGTVHSTGTIEAGTLLQAKGVAYALPDLVGSAATGRAMEGGTHLTIHLAPGDYHRFHWPFDARVTSVRHLPGDLWPVHARAAAALPGLFARNERVVVEGLLANRQAFAVVAVGALNVGSIRLAFHALRTNRTRATRNRAWHVDELAVRRGEEMGHFELGSTLVVLVPETAGLLTELAPGSSLRAGQAVGLLSAGA